jgi:flagellar FliL protein
MADAPEAPEEKGGKKKLIIIIAAAVVLLGIIGAVVWFLFLKPAPPDPEEADPGRQVPVPALEDLAKVGPMVNIDEFVVNIISADSPHYVKTSLTLELSNETTQPEVEERMPQIRDSIILLIGNKTYEELQDLEGKKQLKAELLSRINSFLHSGTVKAVYFTNFVVQ